MDFSVFETDLTCSEESRRAQDDIDWQRNFGSPLPASRFSTIPKRSSSLRKSTLQQRQSERPPLMKSHEYAEEESMAMAATPAFENLKKGQRMSLDNHLPAMPRDSPFSSQGSLLNASIHPVVPSQASIQPTHQPHPLSRTMTQSSSTSSMMDDSPTHEPVHRPDLPNSIHDFSKSLPIGASRPTASFGSDGHVEELSQGSFATPANYKFAKPLPAAFMSTGLISKKNRNNDEPHGGLPKAHMPDTPCKKQPSIFPAVPPYVPSNAPVAAHHARHSFGTPSTPFNSHHSAIKPAPFPFVKGGGIFGNSGRKHSLTRKASFASIENEERSQPLSPLAISDSQSTNDSELPPTPSKKITEEDAEQFRTSPSAYFRKSQLTKSIVPRSTQSSRFTSSKLSPIGASPGSVDEDSDSVMDDSPSASLRLKSSLNAISVPSSFTKGRLLRNLNSPSPISRAALAVPLFHSPRSARTKLACLSPVSPHHDKFERTSPHTPQESSFPPDPSGLFISGHNDRIQRPTSSSSAAIPATPTGPRDYFPNFSNRPSLNLNTADGAVIDQSLVSRFERVELVGTGEFSQVYRVAQPPPTSPYNKMFSVSASKSSSRSSLMERVWAVKKSRHPYAGARDRQRKIHEVDVLKALGHNDHILAFVDSWEEQGHLYIQTEFCEEGTLDVFLAQAGLKARIDDFRIWKILLELSLGLRHIHDSGYIHLDLKPANVLITFEGVLKIADFGMAARWPAKAGIEGEGDREYIGPEILRGQYDKPADVFALGLIMLETAGNVELPDNGASWQKLRNGDMSDVPSLTWSSEASNIQRDRSGNPMPDDASVDDIDGFDEQDPQDASAPNGDEQDHPAQHRKSIHVARSGELLHPPAFMIDATNEQALDNIVRWMISPHPGDRPVATQILQTVGVQWAETRRRAGATIYEGNWGPADEILAEDAEMIDV